MIQFVIPIEPVAWGRVKTGKWGNAYVPTKTRIFKFQFAQAASRFKPASPLAGALQLDLVFQVKPPKRCKRRQPYCRPDLDNYLKAVMDSLGGMFWHDDAQVVTICATKRYGPVALIKVGISRPSDQWVE